MPRVTESLRNQWTNQRAQMLEERTKTQGGEPRSKDDITIVDFDIAVVDHLLTLPLGTKFDAQQVMKDLLAKREGS